MELNECGPLYELGAEMLRGEDARWYLRGGLEAARRERDSLRVRNERK